MKRTTLLSIVKATVILLLSACVLACVSTESTPTAHDPSDASAQTTPLPPVGAAFAQGFDPLALEVQPLPPQTADHEHSSKPAWTCPMHPEIVRAEPGNCPICGMKLVQKKAQEKEKP